MEPKEIQLRRSYVRECRDRYSRAWRRNDIVECVKAARAVDVAESKLARYLELYGTNN